MVDTTKGAQERIPSAKAETAAGRIDGYLPIEQYAAIGDGRALALVGVDGAIDWMCVPDLDSPSIFGALLDPESGGCFVVRPSVPYTSSRRYLERTNVLETTFHTDHGQLRLLDALTIDESQTAPWRELVRELHGVTGTVPVRWEFCPRFGYGRRAARLQPHGSMIVARDHGLQVGLSTWDAGQVEVGEGTARATCEISGGERALIATLVTDNEPLRVPERAEVERRLAETLEVWRSWVSRHSYDGPWIDAVERSLLAIRLLTDARTGAIAAAGTTSLPEVIGGERNYDYRFGWVRDLCFTLDALLAVGMEQLTQASVTWLLAATRHTHPESIRCMRSAAMSCEPSTGSRWPATAGPPPCTWATKPEASSSSVGSAISSKRSRPTSNTATSFPLTSASDWPTSPTCSRRSGETRTPGCGSSPPTPTTEPPSLDAGWRSSGCSTS
jgi:hypothetical protein